MFCSRSLRKRFLCFTISVNCHSWLLVIKEMSELLGKVMTDKEAICPSKFTAVSLMNSNSLQHILLHSLSHILLWLFAPIYANLHVQMYSACLYGNPISDRAHTSPPFSLPSASELFLPPLPVCVFTCHPVNLYEKIITFN